MLIHRLTAAQGCLLSSDINTGETPRRQVFYFFNLMVGGVGHIISSISRTMAMPLGIPPICLRLKLLNVLWLPQQLDSWKDWRYRRACGCITLPHRVSQFGGFVCIIKDLAKNKRPELGEDYAECMRAWMHVSVPMYLLSIRLISNTKRTDLCSLLSGNENSSITNSDPTRLCTSLNFRVQE